MNALLDDNREELWANEGCDENIGNYANRDNITNQELFAQGYNSVNEGGEVNVKVENQINDDSIQAENVESNIKEEAEMNLTGICGTSIAQHQGINSGENPYQYTQYDNYLPQNSHFINQLETSSREKSYQCSQCDSAFLENKKSFKTFEDCTFW